jgi:hypothetical protein
VADVGNTGVPLAMPCQFCPKCKTLRSFVNVDGGLTSAARAASGSGR